MTNPSRRTLLSAFLAAPVAVRLAATPSVRPYPPVTRWPGRGIDGELVTLLGPTMMTMLWFDAAKDEWRECWTQRRSPAHA